MLQKDNDKSLDAIVRFEFDSGVVEVPLSDLVALSECEEDGYDCDIDDFDLLCDMIESVLQEKKFKET